MLRWILVGLVAIAVVSGCGPDHSVIRVGDDGLRTFTVANTIAGQTILCTTGGAIEPVAGTLMGQAGAREPVWLRAGDGSDLSIVWPQGFTVRFEPGAALYDDRGQPVAAAGEGVELGQVHRRSHTGSFEDPYIASGIVFHGCYRFAP